MRGQIGLPSIYLRKTGEYKYNINMRVLIADTFSAKAIKEISKAGLEVIYNNQLDPNSLKKALT